MPPFKGDTVLGRHRERKLSVSWLSMKETYTITESGASGWHTGRRNPFLKCAGVQASILEGTDSS